MPQHGSRHMGKRSREKRERRLGKSNTDADTSRKDNHLHRRFTWFGKPNGNPPDVKTELKRQVYRIVGWPGLVLLLIGGGLLWLLWNWEHARSVPGLGYLVTWIERDPIPLADSSRFSIAVAHLHGDQKGYPNEQLILEALREAGGIQVLRVDRTIHVQASQPEGGEQAGHTEAQDYLRQSGADVLVWGTVLSTAGQTVFKLYLTTNQQSSQGRYQPTGNLSLPESFWTDAKTLLLVLVLGHQNQYKEGIPVSNELSSQIRKIKSLSNAKGQNWEPKFRLLLRVLLAGSLAMLADQSGDLLALEESRDVYQSLLNEVSRETNPTLWAFVQNNLGLVFMQLAFKDGEVTKLEEAVRRFEQALLVRTREKFSIDWALTTANLGVAHRFIGERTRAFKEISLGVTYLRQALQELSAQNELWAWLLTQHRLADALLEMGLDSEGTAELLEAKTIEEKVLKYWTAQTSPIHWPRAQLTLGRIIFDLGERRNSTEDMEKALNLFESLRKHYGREVNPFGWAQVEYRIGYAKQVLGARDKSIKGTTMLKEAIKGLYEVLEIWTEKTNPLGWIETHERIGGAITALAIREEGTKRFGQAEKVYRSALKLAPRKDIPFRWAALNYSLGMTFFWWNEKSNDPRHLCVSYIHLQEAWTTLSELGAKYHSTQAQGAVARILDAFNKRYSKKEFGNCLSRAHRLAL